jgi:hypothetical protein
MFEFLKSLPWLFIQTHGSKLTNDLNIFFIKYRNIVWKKYLVQRCPTVMAVRRGGQEGALAPSPLACLNSIYFLLFFMKMVLLKAFFSQLVRFCPPPWKKVCGCPCQQYSNFVSATIVANKLDHWPHYCVIAEEHLYYLTCPSYLTNFTSWAIFVQDFLMF